MKSLQNQTSTLRLQDISSRCLLSQAEQKGEIKTVLSASMFAVMSLYQDVKPEAVSLVMDGFFEEFQHEPIDLFINVIKQIQTGKKKVYGKVTPDIIRECIVEQLDELAIARENEHNERKGGAGDRINMTLREALSKITTQ